MTPAGPNREPYTFDLDGPKGASLKFYETGISSEQAAQLRAVSDQPRISELPADPRLKNSHTDILALENDAEITGWLAAPAGECECGLPMARWEKLNGGCSTCAPHFPRETCPCGHFSFEGWHMAAADRRVVLGRCKDYWAQRGDVTVTDKKSGERVTYSFAVDPEDRFKLVRSELERNRKKPDW